MKKLFLTDLDNTALGGGFLPYDRFPDHFSRFLDDLSEQGWDWGINTTWDPAGQLALVRRSAVKSRPAFLIGEFGRRVARVEQEELSYLEPYTSRNNAKVRQLCRDFVLPFIAKCAAIYQPVNISYWEHLSELRMPGEYDMEEIRSWLEENTPPELLTCIKNTDRVEIRLNGFSKALPLEMIAADYHYDVMVCAGDAEPDLDMMAFRLTKASLAPANAKPAVKDFIAKHTGAVGEREFAYGIIDAFNSIKNSI